MKEILIAYGLFLITLWFTTLMISHRYKQQVKKFRDG